MKEVRISWTQLRKWYEKKQGGSGRRASYGKSEAFYRGNTGDQLTRLWLSRQDSPMVDLIPEAMQAAASGQSKEGPTAKFLLPYTQRKIRKDFTEVVSRLEPILRDKITPFAYEAPKRFDVSMQICGIDVHLVGELDFFVLHDDGNYSIYDLKITENPDYWRSTLAQLTFYDIAMSSIYPGKLREAGLIQPVCGQPLLKFDITLQERREMFMNIVNYVSHNLATTI